MAIKTEVETPHNDSDNDDDFLTWTLALTVLFIDFLLVSRGSLDQQLNFVDRAQKQKQKQNTFSPASLKPGATELLSASCRPS